MKKYLDLRKYVDHTGIDLMLTYDSRFNFITVTGSRLPQQFIGTGEIKIVRMGGIVIEIKSYSHPQINVDPYADIIEIFLGGEDDNPDKFHETTYIGYDIIAHIDILENFSFQTLNTKIKVI